MKKFTTLAVVLLATIFATFTVLQGEEHVCRLDLTEGCVDDDCTQDKGTCHIEQPSGKEINYDGFSSQGHPVQTCHVGVGPCNQDNSPDSECTYRHYRSLGNGGTVCDTHICVNMEIISLITLANKIVTSYWAAAYATQGWRK